MRNIILIFLTLFLMGCNPQRKLERLLMKYPELRDTIEVEAIVEYIKGDTIFMEPLPGDTIVYTKDRLTVKYVDIPGPTVYLEGECKSDTIKIEVPVVQPTRYVDKFPTWGYFLVGCLLLICILILIRKKD